jgi:uncharacterized protein (UPF0276 family)
VWLRKNFRREVVRIACTIVKTTDLGQVKIIAHYHGYDVVRYVQARNLERVKA